MKAMIMAAGVGSRLMPLTKDIPKPMVPMGNMPVMEHAVRLLARCGFGSVIANLYYQGEVISNYFGNGKDFGLSMSYSREEELMGTAGGVKRCAGFLNETFVVVSGDALTDIDLGLLVRLHKAKGALATIALKTMEDVEQFGVVITDENDKIISFQEKPKREMALSNRVNTGIYVFEPEIFKYIPANRFYDFGQQVFPALVKAGAPFYGVPVNGYWCDIGSINTYRTAQADLLEGRVNMQARGKRLEAGNDARVLIGDNVEIGADVDFKGNVIIGDGCRIEEHARLSNVVVWNNTHISEGVLLNECVIGSDCNLGARVIIHPGAVVASHCMVANEVEVSPYSRVFQSSADGLELMNG